MEITQLMTSILWLAAAIVFCAVSAVFIDWFRSRGEQRQARAYREVLIPDDVMADIRTLRRGRKPAWARQRTPAAGGD